MSTIVQGWITTEGIDGSGKSTLIQAFLQKYGKDYHTSVEPTNGPIGRLIRDILTKKYTVQPKTLLRLFDVDRVEHVEGKLKELLKEKPVLCDRGPGSTLACQMINNPFEEVTQIVINGYLPEIMVYIDIMPIYALNRISLRDDDVSIFDNIDNLSAIHENYIELVKFMFSNEGVHVITLHAGPDISTDTLVDQLKNELDKYYEGK